MAQSSGARGLACAQAGVRLIGGAVEPLDLPPPRALRADEVLLDVPAAGAGNWDEFARTGGWDIGARPPMALGVEAAGLVTAVGDAVAGIRTGDRVAVHSAPLREQGCWAEMFIAAADDVAEGPVGLPMGTAAAPPVPASDVVDHHGGDWPSQVITVEVGEIYPLAQGALALERARHGAHGTAIVPTPGAPD
jgi:NADPH:quinone reductase-like Zn-dependent oxidoreductase